MTYTIKDSPIINKKVLGIQLIIPAKLELCICTGKFCDWPILLNIERQSFLCNSYERMLLFIQNVDAQLFFWTWIKALYNHYKLRQQPSTTLHLNQIESIYTCFKQVLHLEVTDCNMKPTLHVGLYSFFPI